VVDPIVIETAALHKAYGGVAALAGLDLRVPRGSIYGLLGRNGAGKTTAIKVLLGMARPTSGTAHVFGLPADDGAASVEIRARAAFVSEDRDLYDHMSVAEIARFAAGFYPKWRKDLEQEYLRKLGLPAERKVKELSRGMRTKLAFLLALCTGAELLILDEPTAGLDPAANEEVLQALVAHVAREGLTVFLSTHQLADVEQIADHVAIVDRGRALLAGGLEDLRASYRRIQFVFDGPAPEPAFLSPGVMSTKREGRVLTVLTSAGAERIVAEGRALAPVAVDLLPVTLKEIFLETVGAEN
jgi:ABC-2 type transport system ATP-binding protein